MVVDNTSHAIADIMSQIKKTRTLMEKEFPGEEENIPLCIESDEVAFELEKKNTVFNKSLEEETKTISNIA